MYKSTLDIDDLPEEEIDDIPAPSLRQQKWCFIYVQYFVSFFHRGPH
jgi:hypothetical protein